MAINVKNYIIESIKTQDPEIDVREGSAIHDLLINPLSSILQSYQEEHSSILDRQTVKDIEKLSEDELDAVAANYLVKRNQGNIAQGYVTLYFRSPRSVTLPKGIKFTDESGLLEFETVNTFEITKFQMSRNLTDYPNYDTGPIFVQAVTAGAEYNIAPNTISTIKASTITPLKLTNVESFTLGSNSETNEELFGRLKNNIYNLSLGSPEGLKTQIKEQKSTVVDVEVVGAKHPLMIRDLTNLAEDVENYVKEDFYLVHSGATENYHKKHKAFSAVFIDQDESAAIQIPKPSSWTNEFSNAMYQGLYFKDDDFYYAQEDQKILAREFFQDYADPNVQIDLGTVLASGLWQIHDGVHPQNQIWYLDEIQVEGEQLRMGKYLNPDDPAEDLSLQLTLSELQQIYDLVGSNLIGTTDEAYNQLENLINPVNFNNLAPVFHKRLDQTLGVQIDCSMSTSDSSPSGSMCYITTLRDNNVFIPHNGYGMAWRKQPEFLRRINNGTYTPDDVTTFNEQYGISDVTPYVGTLSQESNKKFWKYNVFLVDNDLLTEEVWVGHNQMWDQTSGKNQFLQAAKMWIEPNIRYEFRLKVYSKLAFDAWIYPSDNPPTGSDGTPYSSELKILNRGVTYPPYVPNSAGKHFGVGVSHTYNSEWYLDNIEINSFEESFPMQLFRMHAPADKFPANQGFRVRYWGAGFDPIQYAAAGNVGHSKVLCAVYNLVTQKWETIGTHTATIGDQRYLQEIKASLTPISQYRDVNGFINICAHAANSSAEFPNDTEHSLRSYYVSLDNMDVVGVHRGNATDCYVHDPINIIPGSITFTATGTDVYTKNMPGIANYIQEIISVEDSITGEIIDPTLYSVSITKNGDSFSKEVNYKIDFDIDDITGAELRLNYMHWSYGTAMEAFLTQETRHYPAQDLLLKVMPPTVIEIGFLQYSGGLNKSSMIDVVKNWINSLTTIVFEKSDLVNLLYENGATYVNLNMEITVRRYNSVYEKFTKPLTSTDQRFIIPTDTVSRFFTTNENLAGLEQS